MGPSDTFCSQGAFPHVLNQPESRLLCLDTNARQDTLVLQCPSLLVHIEFSIVFSRHCAVCLARSILLLTATVTHGLFSPPPHFTGEETEAQEGQVPHLHSHHKCVKELGPMPSSSV